MRKEPSQRSRTVAVVGPGAVGGLLAASLRRSGLPVLIAARGASSLAGGKGRLTVRDPKGRLSRTGGFLGPAAAPPEGCAAVFLCVKRPDLRRALVPARRLAGPRAPVVSLLNGLGHGAALRRAFGPARCVLGAAYFAARRTGPASVWHTGGDVIALARTPSNRAAVREARRLLAKAGWRVRTVGSEEALLWTKAVLNASVNPLGALTRGSNAALTRHPAMRDLLSRVADEAARVARAAGHPLLSRDPAGDAVRGSRTLLHQFNSMVQDLEAGRRTEADAILRPFISAARRTKTPIRRLEPLYLSIRLLEKELSR